MQCWNFAGKAPQLEIETSTFASHWQKALEQPQHADVIFITEGQNSFKAHKVVLCSASRFFRQVLSPDLISQVQTEIYKQLKQMTFNSDCVMDWMCALFNLPYQVIILHVILPAFSFVSALCMWKFKSDLKSVVKSVRPVKLKGDCIVNDKVTTYRSYKTFTVILSFDEAWLHFVTVYIIHLSFVSVCTLLDKYFINEVIAVILILSYIVGVSTPFQQQSRHFDPSLHDDLVILFRGKTCTLEMSCITTGLYIFLQCFLLANHQTYFCYTMAL